jgi:hypothetical protein
VNLVPSAAKPFRKGALSAPSTCPASLFSKMTMTTWAGAAVPVGTTLDRTSGAATVIGKAAELLGGEAVISLVAAGVVGLTWLASSWLPAAPVGAVATVHPASMTTTLASSAVRHAPRETCVDLGATSSTVRIADRGRLPCRRHTRADRHTRPRLAASDDQSYSMSRRICSMSSMNA